ncbi:hypothetical protein [Paenibacillus sp. FSL R5-0519]
MKNIVERHGGTVEMKSIMRQGTQVNISLPGEMNA